MKDPEHCNRIAGTNHERLAALSDGIFAFAMTLLIQDPKVPGRAFKSDGNISKPCSNFPRAL